ncbi:hypothetical protein [Streptomyces sp. NPDC017941]|uniref:hypothetical protein n=1 Tax=Streptomyces sp. NPDC017941 TaxID=3365018 RepID=UPI0037972890
MSTQDDDYRAFSYWPSKDERRVVAVARSAEVDAMSDEELVVRQLRREEPASKARVVARDEPGGGQTIIVVERNAETDRKSDAEILAQADKYKRDRRLRAVDDSE